MAAGLVGAGLLYGAYRPYYGGSYGYADPYYRPYYGQLLRLRISVLQAVLQAYCCPHLLIVHLLPLLPAVQSLLRLSGLQSTALEGVVSNRNV